MPDVIDKVMSFISGDDEHISDKDVLLKQLAKEISQNKYAKFYRTRQREADVSLGQYFFDLYKALYPLQSFLNNPANEAKIRHITLEAFLDKPVMDIIKRLSPNEIAERKRNAGPEISKQLKEDLTALAAGFDNPKIAAADKCNNLIASMKQFVAFSFITLLEKFDPEMKEGDFLSIPRFAPIDASILVPDLSKFLSLLPPFEPDDDWKTVFEILKYCKGGVDVIPLLQWNNILLSLNDLKSSRVLELICKLSSGNPIFEIRPVIPHETLSAGFLEQKTSEVREVIANILGSQKQTQVDALVQAVFGPIATTRLSYYNDARGRVLIDKNLDGYVYAPALNHLLTFIQEYHTKEFQELCDIVLIRGKWTKSAASRAMSEGFHSVLDITNEILHLDESLSEDGSEGPRLRSALARVDRDKTQIRYINNIIAGINDEALHLINKAVPSLIVLGKHFKMLFDDYDKKPFELIMNWKELTAASKAPISQRISAAYKRINYFVQLMIMETKETEE